MTPAPDSIGANGETLIVFAAGEETSPELVAIVFDLTTDPQAPQPIAEIPVTFIVTDPAPGSAEAQGFFLTNGEATDAADPHMITVATDEAGLASIMVGRVSSASLPESASVEATAETAIGVTVTGSPVTYTVIF